MEIIYVLLVVVILMLGIIAYRIKPIETASNSAECKDQDKPKTTKTKEKEEPPKDREVWRTIYIDSVNTGYKVSNKGNFKKPNGRHVTTRNVEELTGERRIAISYNNTKKQIYASRLVATEFVENPNHWFYVKHLDGDTLNNNAENLRWVYSKRKGGDDNANSGRY